MQQRYAIVCRMFLAVLSFTLFSAFSHSVNTCVKHTQICSFIEDLRTRAYFIVEGNQKVRSLLGEAVREVLDFQEMSKFVMGPYWKEATVDQRTRFADAYGKYIEDVYVTQLQTFARHRMKIMYVREQDDNIYTARVRLVHPEQRDDFVVLEFQIVSDTTPKIGDIRINNSISIAVSQRSVVFDIIKKYGIDGAISHFTK